MITKIKEEDCEQSKICIPQESLISDNMKKEMFIEKSLYDVEMVFKKFFLQKYKG